MHMIRKWIAIVSLSLLLLACIGSPLQAQNRGFTAYAGYTGSFCDVKSYGADLSLAYNIPVYLSLINI